MSTPRSTDERAETVPEFATEETPAVVCVRNVDGEVVCGPVVDAPAERATETSSERVEPSRTMLVGSKHCATCGAFYRKDFDRCPSDGGAIVVAASDPLLGRQLGHYVIDALIGEGGMGRVYRAHHAHLDKPVALKVLLGDVAAAASMRKRFAKEAQIASKLAHPNLVPVLDFGASPRGLSFIVMELVDGVALGALVDAAAMPPARVARLATAICEGLAYLHDAGLVHRDLKPDNVIVVHPGGREVPRVTDFGLARTTEQTDERLTSTGTAMGTPLYAPPEQIAGKIVDARADLYALGVSMFEMLTGGEPPWRGDALEVATAKAHRDPPSVSAFAPAPVPRALESLISRLLRGKPEQRPASAREVIAALSKIEG